MSVTLSSLPRKFKCSLLNGFFIPMELLPTPNNTYIYIYIYIYIFGNEGVLHIPQISKTGTSSSDGLMSYPKYSLVGLGLTPLLRCSWCILQPQSIGPFNDIKFELTDMDHEQNENFHKIQMGRQCTTR